MTVSSGFFNSVNHDRLYDAEQLSSIFDGVIVDGVYENVGEAFNVTAYPDAYNTVLVGTGRAWFDHTWTLNDSRFSITLDPPNEMLGRIDAIVIDVNKERDTRKNSIIYLKGDEATPDFPPTLINTENHHQYPIAYITRHAEQNGPIKQSDIEITVGTGACPIATGVLEAQNLENLMQQLDAEFNEWWEGIKAVLDENVATNLQNQIDAINEKLNGDTALVGLLEKPIAEAFMSGDYGLSVTSYNVPLTKYPELELHNTVSFLPNGEVVSLGFEYESKLGSVYNFTLTVNFVDPSGVTSKQTVDISDYVGISSQSSNSWDEAGYVVLVNSKVNAYPAEFVFIIRHKHTYNSNPYMSETLMTIKISSSKTVQASFSDTKEYPNTENTWLRKLMGNSTVNSIKLSDGSFIIGDVDETYGGDGAYDNEHVIIFASTVSSDNVLQTGKKTEISVNGVKNDLKNPYIIFNLVDSNIIAYLVDSSNSNDNGTRVVINSETLDGQFLENAASTYPAHSKYEYKATYGVETYTLSENNGVEMSVIEAGDDPDPVSEKRSSYFIGASNLGDPLPEGTFIGAKDENGRLYGIASSGEQIAIGNNGGCAILKAKKTVSSSIDISKVVLWCMGYYVGSDFTGYLMVTGTRTSPYSYKYDSMSGTKKTASVVKISRGV